MRIHNRLSTLACAGLFLLALHGPCPSFAGEEARLPSCPPDWTVEIVATTSPVLHPTAVACAPDGRVFVCEDDMDMSGPVDQPVNRILCVHPGGRVTTFAERVYAVFGMEYIDGKLFVHHSPRFSVFEDGGNEGKNRVELIGTTNPAPWGSAVRGKNQINDHVPAGFALGMDGYLYIAVGDKGVHGFVGRDGRRLELPLGGVVRMRPNGTGAEVYATGFRTVLNPAINAAGEIFLYDNNDHLNFHKVAVGQVVDGGYYGYPWDARPPRPAYVLPLDVRVFEAGAPTNLLAYEEDGLPESYRGNLFLCDWGRRELIRLGLERRGAGYRTVVEERLLSGDVRPTGIAVAPDARTVYVGDWQFPGWREDVKAGRLLKLTYRGTAPPASRPGWYLPAALGREVHASTDELIGGLAHPSQSVRLVAQRRIIERGRDATPALIRLLRDAAAPQYARWHAVWALDAIDGGISAREALLAAVDDPEPSIRAQAIRALGTRRIDEAHVRLVGRLQDPNAAVRFQAVTALGRLGDTGCVRRLRDILVDTDPLIRHAAFTALNRIGRANPAAWEEITEGLADERPRVREGTHCALRETYDPALVTALVRLAGRASLSGAIRAEVYQSLFALHRAPAEWDGTWWRLGPLGFLEDSRDASPSLPKPRNWSATPTVTEAIHAALDDPEPRVRGAAVAVAFEALDHDTVSRLVRLLEDPSAAMDRPAILQALGGSRSPEATGAVLAVLRHPAEPADSLRAVIAAAVRQGGPAVVDALAALGESVPAPALIDANRALGELRSAAAIPALGSRLRHRDARVRSSSAQALGRIGNERSVSALIEALNDTDVWVRREAVIALGTLKDAAAVPALLRAYRQGEARAETLAALARIPDPRAIEVYLEGLGQKDPAVRDACRRALADIGDAARSTVRERLSSAKLPGLVVQELASVYGNDREMGPLLESARMGSKPEEYAAFVRNHPGDPARGKALFEAPHGVGCLRCHRVSGRGGEGGPDLTHIAANYGRAELAESILYPSKKVGDGFRTTIVALRGGEVLSGVVVRESNEGLTLIDRQGQSHTIRGADIEARRYEETSSMPERLESGLTHQEFADLVSYLETLR